jgi:formylglycine-generating enzyme required for sulfatase activity
MYLEDTKAERLPEYWDNSEYNQPEQPVIGVSYEDAVRFASWLSAQLGVAKRLPTEDEWEKAARGGREVIYPWGDQSPDGGRANYSGNGRFRSTSPVGSFEAGKNAYGLYDMAGNVWQWTSTGRAGTGRLIVKGGSWMDGPADLRVSNRREVDPSKGYVDVGFRLVREVAHE